MKKLSRSEITQEAIKWGNRCKYFIYNQFISLKEEGLVMVIDKNAQFDTEALSNFDKYEFI